MSIKKIAVVIPSFMSKLSTGGDTFVYPATPFCQHGTDRLDDTEDAQPQERS